ncbi:DUF354 domain-containing protein [Paludibacter sp.]|uniref:DUF354 domain-containing protein n=1 Tax=Paludibacter sp. TaxID=1898105 RepID=UPI00135354F5|nr:DUF354 domain-containing protein [Paludibacter sp.]MTK52052.1 DUF354 domain-containing protein [Paludibacter sp.]
MRIALYISHPAQYLFFRNPIRLWKEHGHEIKIFIRTKDVLAQLMQYDNVTFENVMPHGRKPNVFDITKAFIYRTSKLFFKILIFKPDILLGTDASVAHIAVVLRRPCITTLEDDYNVIKRLALLTYPFTKTILTPECCNVGRWKSKKIGYNGLMKLSYLHPSRFKPDNNIIIKYAGERPYCLIRLSRLTAYHDMGIVGLSQPLIKKEIEICQKQGRKVFVSAEGELNPEFEPYRLTINPSDIHHVLAGADLLVSDSQSMSVEAAILGVPSIRFSDFSGRISVLEELEHKYHLTYGIPTSEPERLLTLTGKILSIDNRKELYQERKNQLIADKIDVAPFITWFVENYPKSKNLMLSNPDIQYSVGKDPGHLTYQTKKVKDDLLSKSSDFTFHKYIDLLHVLKHQGFEFRTFEEFCQGQNEGKFVILRHDIDARPYHALQCAEIEHQEGIPASYYFRIVRNSNRPEIIQKIADLGHEIGYHYEEMSLTKGDTKKSIVLFEKNLAYFRQFYPIKTICMHGSPTSSFSNIDLWKHYNYRQSGIIGEPYFDIDFNKFMYLTDTGRCWDGQSVSIRDKVKGKIYDRFHSTNDIIAAAISGQLPNKIMITTHPQRWTDNQWKWVFEFVSQGLKNQIKRIVIHYKKTK